MGDPEKMQDKMQDGEYTFRVVSLVDSNSFISYLYFLKISLKDLSKKKIRDSVIIEISFWRHPA